MHFLFITAMHVLWTTSAVFDKIKVFLGRYIAAMNHAQIEWIQYNWLFIAYCNHIHPLPQSYSSQTFSRKITMLFTSSGSHFRGLKAATYNHCQQLIIWFCYTLLGQYLAIDSSSGSSRLQGGIFAPKQQSA